MQIVYVLYFKIYTHNIILIIFQIKIVLSFIFKEKLNSRKISSSFYFDLSGEMSHTHTFMYILQSI